MDSSGNFRSAPLQRWPPARIVAAGIVLIGLVCREAVSDDLVPPSPGAGDVSDADSNQPSDDPAPLPGSADLATPESPLPPAATPPPPPETGAPPASAFPSQGPVDGVEPALEATLDGGFPAGGEPGGPRGAVGLTQAAADGTVSVLVPSAPAMLSPNASAGALPPAGLPPTPSFNALPPPPPTGVQGATPPLPPQSSQAAELIGRGLDLPFPLVARSPTAEITPPKPLPLLEALERSGDRTRRLWITQAYWKLAAAAARVRFAAEAEERLSLVAPGESPDDLVLLDLATAAARGESASAGVELVAAQQEIVDLVRLPVTEPPPWPVDRPLTTAYQTHFETIFAGRPATGRVRAIHRQLPLEHAAVVSRGEACVAAQRRFEGVESMHARGSTPIDAVLSSHDALVEQTEAFVAAVRAYNLDIAEYVMAVADLSVPDERFASMLIGQPIPWRQPVAAGFQPQDRVVSVAGQSFLQALPGGGPEGFPAGAAPLQPSPPRGLQPSGGGGGLPNPGEPGRFNPPANVPQGGAIPLVSPTLGS